MAMVQRTRTGAGSVRRDMVAERVTVLMDNVQVTGSVHTEPGKARFSDAFEALVRGRREFLPITEATVRDLVGGEVGVVDFMLVDRDDVVGAFPEEGRTEAPDPRARKLDRDRIMVALTLRNLRVEGTVHLDPDRSRFSDAWETLLFDQRRFIPVTGATITTHDRGQLATPRFVAIDKGDVLAVHPLETNGYKPSAARRVDRKAVEAVLVMDNLRIEGTIHANDGRPGFERFSDLWDVMMRDPRRFIPVTAATILSIDGRSLMGAADLMVVDKDEVRAAFPAGTAA